MDSFTLETTAALFRAADTPVIGAQGGRIVFANPAAFDALGFDPVGQSVSSVLPERLTGLQSGLGAASCRVRGRNAVATLIGAGTLRIYTLRPESGAAWIAPPAPAQLNTLAEMRMATEMLRCDENLSPESAARTLQLTLGCFRLQRWFDNLSTLSALQAGTLPFQPAETDCAALLRALAERVLPISERRGITLTTYLPESPGGAAVDPVLLERLLLNLLSNSLLHCTRGSRIRLGMAETEKELTITVQDTGSGISPERMGGLFSGQALHTVFNRQGAACGLPAVLGITRLHRGELLIDTTPDVGTTVIVTLPRRQNPCLTLRAEAADYHAGDQTAVLIGLADTLEAEDLQ